MSTTQGRKLGVDLFGEDAVDPEAVVEGSADKLRFEQFLSGHDEESSWRPGAGFSQLGWPSSRAMISLRLRR